MQGWRARIPIIVVAVLVFFTVAMAFAPPSMYKAMYRWQISLFASRQDQQMARRYLDMLLAGKTSALEAEIDPSQKQQFHPQIIAKMEALVASKKPPQIDLIGYRNTTTNGENYRDATFQLQNGNSTTVVDIAFSWSGVVAELEGMHVQTVPEPLDEMNAFTMNDKGASQYVALVLAALVAAFTIVTLFVCAAAPSLPRKWLWLLAIVVGVGRFSVNWTTGYFAVSPIWIGLPPVSTYAASPYAPWIIAVAFPLGAMWFWIKCYKIALGIKRTEFNPLTSAESAQA